jgi:hypothetical protein
MSNIATNLRAMVAAFLMTVLVGGGLWAMFEGVAADELALAAAVAETTGTHARG